MEVVRWLLCKTSDENSAELLPQEIWKRKVTSRHYYVSLVMFSLHCWLKTCSDIDENKTSWDI